MSNACEACGVDVWGPLCPLVPSTDGLGRYWMERRCPNCEAVLSRIYPPEDGALRDDLRKRAELVDDPPSVTNMPEGMTNE